MKELVGSRILLPSFEKWAGLVGFHDGEYHATFEQHADRVLRLADALKRELHLERGGRFAVMAANGHEMLELYHAAFVGGGVINPLNLRLAPKELQNILADSGTEVVFVDSLFAGHLLRSIGPIRSELPLKAVVLIGDGDHIHDGSYEELLELGHPTPPDEPDEDDPVVLMYTGGTTGLPKGVLLD
ncbi:MAG TPA: AMP-binding protein, partial [Acidimicrobiales bacterium]|nr:AMP-binding protein [Acidimicrobiales bacterium]